MAFVAGISFEHVILCDQTNGAFGKKNFVSELYRGSDLAALDQIGMWFENRVDLLGVGNLLAPEYTAACLIDHSVCQAAVVLNLFSQLSDSYVSDDVFSARLASFLKSQSRTFNDLLGNADAFAIFANQVVAPLRRGHPLDFIHPAPCRASAVAEPLDTPTFEQFGEATDQARDDAHRIPNQGIVCWMMNVCLNNRGIDTKLLAVFQTQSNRKLHQHIIDAVECLRAQPHESALERIMLGNRLRIEIGELAQRIAICDPFAQFAIVKILDAHENQ